MSVFEPREKRLGQTKWPEYHVWQSMRARCYKPSTNNYDRYGGRGIEVCERWQKSFLNFIDDMGRRPSDLHSIDRIDGDGNYSPENCRWATIIEQSDNKERTHKVMFRGKLRTYREVSEITGIAVATVAYRGSKGLPLDSKLYESRLGKEPPNKGNKMKHYYKKCSWCTDDFVAKRKSQRFCSNVCSAKWHSTQPFHKRLRDPATNTFKQGLLTKGE